MKRMMKPIVMPFLAEADPSADIDDSAVKNSHKRGLEAGVGFGGDVTT